MATCFQWKTRERDANLAIYLNRHKKSGPMVDSLHYHDFAELLYARKGKVKHTINSQERIFKAGEIILIRPAYSHQMQLDAGEYFEYDVIAFKPTTLSRITRRHLQEMGDFWDMKSKDPITAMLTKRQMLWLESNTSELAANSSSKFLVERFFLNLAYEISLNPPRSMGDTPLWLVQAIHKLDDIELSKRGPRILSDLTGRSFEHICRVLKQTSGLTPSQVVNRKRIEHAASQLLLSNDGILEIAIDCGFQSLGHFYKEFRNHYEVSPRQYRIRNMKAR